MSEHLSATFDETTWHDGVMMGYLLSRVDWRSALDGLTDDGIARMRVAIERLSARTVEAAPSVEAAERIARGFQRVVPMLCPTCGLPERGAGEVCECSDVLAEGSARAEVLTCVAKVTGRYSTLRTCGKPRAEGSAWCEAHTRSYGRRFAERKLG